MANTFKNATARQMGTSWETLYTVPSSTTTVILGLTLANTNAAARTVTVGWLDFATSESNYIYLLNEVSIPGDTTLEVFAGQKIVLEATDVLKVFASAVASIDATLSYMEIT